MKTKIGVLSFAGFVLTVFLANYSIKNVGTVCVSSDGPCLIPVWFGVMAPSGVLWAGLALTVRDVVQRTLGFWWSWIAVVSGALLSALLDPSLAIASGLAFFVAETLDLFVYTPLQRKNLYVAVAASNLVGLVVDSYVFLSIAGMPLSLIAGMVIGKTWMTIAALAFLPFVRKGLDKVVA